MADTRPLSERLADLIPSHPRFAAVAPLLIEAAEVLARYERAPVVEVKAAGTDPSDGACRVYAITTPEELAAAPPIIYRRCRIVEVPE